MLPFLLSLAGGLLIIWASLRARIRLSAVSQTRDKLGDVTDSPLARAISSLLGTAGGIYLSLVMACAFLEIEVPDRVLLGGFSLEPLALISLGLAVLQPFVLRAGRFLGL